MKRIPIRTLLLICLVALCVPGVAGASPVSTAPVIELSQQTDPVAEGAADAARELSRLEAAREFTALYEHMHPDALAVVPESVVVGWYEAFFSDRVTSELRVIDSVAEPWTWGVTGQTYDDAVTVHFVQPYVVNGQPEEVAGEVHLVPSGDEWGWFFGASAGFLDEQIALYGDDSSTQAQELAQGVGDVSATIDVPRDVLFPDPLHAHVDAYWAKEFASVGLSYDSPNGVIAFDEPLVTACGRANPEEEAAFYCVVDEKIYYSQTFRDLIERQIGDFAWVVVVAHEWAHHIQGQLGYELGVSPDSSVTTPPIGLEQQADCLAGAYSID
ncbi:MAG TPA: neutral zinc metallopeptidase, partial [Nitrospiraceae bacterium]|nr:neutral zinc metallopeptidase [Nitrospiraceae bacterium]